MQKISSILIFAVTKKNHYQLIQHSTLRKDTNCAAERKLTIFACHFIIREVDNNFASYFYPQKS